MNMDYQKLSLDNIGNGAAVELFQHELSRVIKNIKDINTGAKTKRTITMKFTFSPNEDRDYADIVINTTSTMAPVKGSAGSTYLQGHEAFTKDQTQTDMFNNVEEMKKC